MVVKGAVGTGNNNSDSKGNARKYPEPFYKRLPEEKPRAPTFVRVSPEEAAAQLRVSASGWDAEVERLLGFPKGLFRADGASSIHFSSKQGVSVPPFLSHELGYGNVRLGRAEYCIAIQEGAESGYFFLVDRARRIMVYAEIYSLTGDSEKGPGWENVKSAIKSALDLADSKDARENGLFAVYYIDSVRLARAETIH